MTLELLQQFYLCVEEAFDDSHKMFPGGKYCTSLKCIRCNQRVTSDLGRIIDTLLQAPTAILRHFHTLETHEVGNDSGVTPSLESLRLMFTSPDTFMASKESFEKGIHLSDRILLKLVFCTSRCDEEFKFCEAVKVDLSNASKTKHYTEAVTHIPC